MSKALWWSALAGLATAWFLPIAAQMANQGDYAAHIKSAIDLAHGIVRVPHLLFHVTMVPLLLGGVNPAAAAAIATVIFQVAAAAAVAWFIQQTAPHTPRVVVIALALAVVLVGPILPPGTDRDLYMLGYFLPNAIHNPTVIAAKPFVPLLLSIGAAAVGTMQRPRWTMVAAAVVTVLAAVAKPHYVSCLVPAAVMWAVVRKLRGEAIRLRLLAGGLAVPALVAIVPIYAMVQTFPEDKGVIVAPLLALGFHVSVQASSLLQHLASDIAFPLVVAACWPRAIIRVPWLGLAWGAYVVALAQAFLLAESGPRLADGNFLWSPQLATFGLFTASVVVIARARDSDSSVGRSRLVLAALVLAAHVVSGVWWVSGRVNVIALP